MTHTGSCLCGAATFTVTTPISQAGACHCDMCRKWSGGILTSVEVPQDGLTVTSGDTISVFTSSAWGERAFCTRCGSGLWFRLTMPGPQHGMHYVNMGALDDPSGITLTEELFIDAKPEGYALAGNHHRMTGAEFFAMIEAATKG
ncbi:GFA family protein [Roseovarius sp. S4756]|uniref:GFA family protein n=1 Tax=Roseovarius maritimus TaxID=3342637 RepID=UPI0037264067